MARLEREQADQQKITIDEAADEKPIIVKSQGRLKAPQRAGMYHGATEIRAAYVGQSPRQGKNTTVTTTMMLVTVAVLASRNQPTVQITTQLGPKQSTLHGARPERRSTKGWNTRPVS